MRNAIDEAIRDRVEFERFNSDTIARAALALVRFGIDAFDELRSTRADQRVHFISGAKKSYGFKSLKLLRELFALSPPLRKGRNIAHVEFTEVHLANRLQSFTANLSSLAGSLRPSQDMVNAVSELIARGESNPQPYHPYIAPNLSDRPWLPRLSAHVNALAAWKAKNRGSRKQSISFQMWLRHHMRFIFADEMCNAWAPFGGLASQLNHVAVLLSLATLENAGFAMKYHDLLVTTLSEYARARFPCDYRAMLSEVNEETCRAVTRDSTAPPKRFPFAAPLSTQRSQKGKQRSQKGGKVKGNPNKGNKGKGAKKGVAHDRSTGKGNAPLPTAAIPAAVSRNPTQ